MKRPAITSLTAFALGAALAACGESGGYNKATQNSSPSAVSITVHPSELGSFLVDGHGRTLYLFAADKASLSTCYSACANLWPPLTSQGPVKAGAGVTGSQLGTTKRDDGTTEVTYGGHPLYYYAGDNGPGDTAGQALDQFGAKWFVVAGDGKGITAQTG